MVGVVEDLGYGEELWVDVGLGSQKGHMFELGREERSPCRRQGDGADDEEVVQRHSLETSMCVDKRSVLVNALLASYRVDLPRAGRKPQVQVCPSQPVYEGSGLWICRKAPRLSEVLSVRDRHHVLPSQRRLFAIDAGPLSSHKLLCR